MDATERRVILDDPALFIVTYFAHRIAKLKDFHVDLIRTVTRERRALILYPATHGKTTLVSTLMPIYWLCRDPNVRIAIIGKNDTEVHGIMQVIQAELLENQELIRDFGPFKPDGDDNKPWAQGRMSVAKRTRRAKEPTITVFGSGAKTVLGYRTDKTICDDVITDQNSATPEQRQKIKDWFNLCVSTGPEHPESQLIVVGTRFEPNDLYADIEDLSHPDTGEQLWCIRSVDAIVSEDDKTTLWPERWSWERLMVQKAQNGTLNFNKRYRNIAVDPSRMVFKEEYVRGGYIGSVHYPGCLDKSYRVGDHDPGWKLVAGFDPAVGTGKKAKFCAHVTLASGSCVDHERCYWIVDCERLQLTLPQQVDMVIQKHQDYQLMLSQIEANSYQAGLYQAIQQKMQDTGHAFKIDPHYTNRMNKPDPELGVQSMGPWFERGQVHIPWGDSHSQRKMMTLVDELIMYPGKTTDTVMATWFAWRAHQLAGHRFESFNRLTKTAPMWGQRLNRRTLVNPAYQQEIQPLPG